jgi:P pilus assembly chaperone PapD
MNATSAAPSVKDKTTRLLLPADEKTKTLTNKVEAAALVATTVVTTAKAEAATMMITVTTVTTATMAAMLEATIRMMATTTMAMINTTLLKPANLNKRNAE